MALFTGDGPSFLQKRRLKILPTFWFSELEETGAT
jgi:hypothetical protein